MRVLVGGPASETGSEMFRAHVEGLERQGGDENESLSVYEVDIRHVLVEPDGYAVRWHYEKVKRVAEARQRMLNDAKFGYDGLFMVDTDVVLGPGVLDRLWRVDAPVVYGVFWTQCDWGNAPGVDVWPQVWSHYPYNFDEETWGALTAKGVNEVPVRCGGACTLIRGAGFDSRYFPLLESLEHMDNLMCGEDRTFALGLECRGVSQVGVTGLPIVHLYEDWQRTPENVQKAKEMVGL